jgi:alpha-D-glucose phosphate-specific phosphoglucomutase
MSVIQFGTDGWRGVIAREFTFANVAVVTQAIAMYIKAQGLEKQGVLIGYDNRFLGNLFAERVAEVLAGNRIPALLCDAPAPTPAVAAAIIERGLAGAMMITASHNPAEYNGIKFIPDYAGPATPEITDQITHYVREVEAGDVEVQVIPVQRGLKEGIITCDSPRRGYIEQLRRVVNGEAIRGAGLKVVIDPMHGAGIGYLEQVLRELGVEVLTCLRNVPDPLFGGDLPEPSAEKLSALAEAVQEKQAHLGLALDGDADRFGIIDGSGAYVTPNEVFALLTHYFITHSNISKIARTVATTHWVDCIAREHGVQVVETPVGFKYIGAQMRQGAEIGGEESGGLSIAAHIPEKDGLLVGLLMLEVIAQTGRTPKQLLQEIGEQYGTVVNERVDCRMSQEQKDLVLHVMRHWNADRIGDWHLVEKKTIDGVKLCFHTGAWVLVRASGTEPLVRIYLEGSDRAELELLRETMLEVLGLTV